MNRSFWSSVVVSLLAVLTFVLFSLGEDFSDPSCSFFYLFAAGIPFFMGLLFAVDSPHKLDSWGVSFTISAGVAAAAVVTPYYGLGIHETRLEDVFILTTIISTVVWMITSQSKNIYIQKMGARVLANSLMFVFINHGQTLGLMIERLKRYNPIFIW